MPAGFVKDEAAWDKAKAAARKQYPDLGESDRFWAIVMTIYKNMTKGGSTMSKAMPDGTRLILWRRAGG